MPENTEKKTTEKNEGEGSKSAARHYNEGVERSMKVGRTEELAKEAEDALDGPEGDALRRAEEEGKSHAANRDRK